MCKYVSRQNNEKLIFLDIHGGSATMQTRSKSRLTNGFNILKVDNNTLYILSIIIGEEKEMHKIYKINSSEETLSGIDTSLEGYNEKKLFSIVGEKMPEPCCEADSLNIIILYFASLPGTCDVLLKSIKEFKDKVTIKVIPLITKVYDSYGNKYYPYNGGNFRDILELAIQSGEITEFKKGNYNNIRKNKELI